MPMTFDQIVEEASQLPSDVLAELIDRILAARHGGIDPVDEDIVKLGTPFKAKIQESLDANLKPWLMRELRGESASTSSKGVDEIRAETERCLRGFGLKDPHDMWNLIVVTVASEYWCQVLNEANSRT